jgi:hypothetical protein
MLAGRRLSLTVAGWDDERGVWTVRSPCHLVVHLGTTTTNTYISKSIRVLRVRQTLGRGLPLPVFFEINSLSQIIGVQPVPTDLLLMMECGFEQLGRSDTPPSGLDTHVVGEPRCGPVTCLQAFRNPDRQDLVDRIRRGRRDRVVPIDRGGIIRVPVPNRIGYVWDWLVNAHQGSILEDETRIHGDDFAVRRVATPDDRQRFDIDVSIGQIGGAFFPSEQSQQAGIEQRLELFDERLPYLVGILFLRHTR